MASAANLRDGRELRGRLPDGKGWKYEFCLSTKTFFCRNFVISGILLAFFFLVSGPNLGGILFAFWEKKLPKSKNIED